MNELLINSGIEANQANISFYGGMNVTIYLLGWAIGAPVIEALAGYLTVHEKDILMIRVSVNNKLLELVIIGLIIWGKFSPIERF